MCCLGIWVCSFRGWGGIYFFLRVLSLGLLHVKDEASSFSLLGVSTFSPSERPLYGHKGGIASSTSSSSYLLFCFFQDGLLMIFPILKWNVEFFCWGRQDWYFHSVQELLADPKVDGWFGDLKKEILT